MKRITAIAFRYLTQADFFNINKPSGTERGGGGQSYIDFPIQDISAKEWDNFFKNTTGLTITNVTQGKSWEFPVKSIGLVTNQKLKIFQRRPQSICVASQKLHSRSSNRVQAWLPANGFPCPKDPSQHNTLPSGLVIFLAKTDNGEVWAGWNIGGSIYNDATAKQALSPIVSNTSQSNCGMIFFSGTPLLMDETNLTTPFSSTGAPPVAIPASGAGTASKKMAPIKTAEKVGTKKTASSARKMFKVKTDEEILEDFFSSDEALPTGAPAETEKIVKIKARNKKAVKKLKQLYKGRCQITGVALTFQKKDGTYYSEGHHLVPLGEDGADSPNNIVILSPLMHRMLHYANVDDFNLASMKDNKLDIKINGETHTITWHQAHAKLVQDSVNDE